MRRHDREITDRQELLAVIRRCDVCRLALNDDGYPYILPLNFGLNVETDRVEFYFHGASEGYKYELMKRDNRASFEMDCSHRLVTDEEKGNCTMEYESVIGRGRIEMVPDEEKRRALDILMAQYHKEDFTYDTAVIPRTKVYKLVVESMTGKRRMTGKS